MYNTNVMEICFLGTEEPDQNNIVPKANCLQTLQFLFLQIIVDMCTRIDKEF